MTISGRVDLPAAGFFPGQSLHGGQGLGSWYSLMRKDKDAAALLQPHPAVQESHRLSKDQIKEEGTTPALQLRSLLQLATATKQLIKQAKV